MRELLSRRAFPRWVVAAWIAACLYSALTLYGYHHEDEFGQITAFSLAKLGVLDDSGMPWEYERQARSWLQPALYYILYLPLVSWFGAGFLALERAAFLLDFLLVVVATWAFTRLVVSEHASRAGPLPPLGLVGAVAFWFLPSMMVRHSSEALSAVLLVLALWCWAGERDWKATAAGVLAGLAFWVRFQTGFIIAGFVAMLVFRRGGKLAAGRSFLAGGGLLLACAVGIAVDYWGYGELALTPWNYFVVNIREGAASGFGTEPWYWYPLATSAVCLNPLLWFWAGRAVRNRWKDALLGPVAAGVTVFVAAHILVPHKELRFLLPVLPLAMLLVLADLRGRRLSRYYGVVAALNVAAFCVFAMMGSKGPRNQAEYSLWKLDPPVTVYSATDLYHRFDGGFRAVPPEGRLDGLVRKPQGVRYVYASPNNFADACRLTPDAHVLITNSQTGIEPPGQPWIDRPIENLVSEFPPGWVPPLLTDRIRTWRHKLAPCSAITDSR